MLLNEQVFLSLILCIFQKKGFNSRKAFFCQEETGFFSKKYESQGNDLLNPNMMTDMIKKNVLNGLYDVVIFLGEDISSVDLYC